jgi:hypothetical protein
MKLTPDELDEMIPTDCRRRDPLNSIAYALCANDESDEPDYGNDAVAEMILAQLVADGHITNPQADGRASSSLPVPEGE